MPVSIACSQYLCVGGTIILVWQLIYRNTKLVVYKAIAVQGLWQNMLIEVKSNKIVIRRIKKKNCVHKEHKKSKIGTLIEKRKVFFNVGLVVFIECYKADQMLNSWTSIC